MRQGQDRFPPLVSGKRAAEAGRSEHLNEAQRRVVSETLSNRDRIFAVQGVAGSGKTTALKEIRIAAQQDGYKVKGLAPTSRATSQLEQAGIDSMTLQRHLAQPASDKRGHGELYVHTAQLDDIVRQKDPALKQVVNDLAHGNVREAVSELQKQGRGS